MLRPWGRGRSRPLDTQSNASRQPGAPKRPTISPRHSSTRTTSTNTHFPDFSHTLLLCRLHVSPHPASKFVLLGPRSIGPPKSPHNRSQGERLFDAEPDPSQFVIDRNQRDSPPTPSEQASNPHRTNMSSLLYLIHTPFNKNGVAASDRDQLIIRIAIDLLLNDMKNFAHSESRVSTDQGSVDRSSCHGGNANLIPINGKSKSRSDRKNAVTHRTTSH